MYDKERAVKDCKIQKVGDKMATIKTSKISQSNIDNEKFYINFVLNCPLDKNLYLFKLLSIHHKYIMIYNFF